MALLVEHHLGVGFLAGRTMLQQTLRRFLPTGLISSLQAQAPYSSKLGVTFSENSFAGQFQTDEKGREQSFQPSFHVPSLLSMMIAPGNNEQAGTVQNTRSCVTMGNMMSTVASRKRSAPLGLSSSSLTMPQPSFAARAFHSSVHRPLGLPAMPKGLGLGLSTPRKTYAAQTRSYLTEGEMLGAAYLLTTDIMFWSGLIGAVVFRRNLIVMLLCTEIVMLACNMNFLFASAYLNDMTGVIMSITITTIAACETAIGLALCVTYFHIRSATDVEALNLLK